MTKDFKLLEHILIPAALFALNCAAVHLLYLLFMGDMRESGALVVILTVSLAVGIFQKNKYLLVPAIAGYAGVLIFSVCW